MLNDRKEEQRCVDVPLSTDRVCVFVGVCVCVWIRLCSAEGDAVSSGRDLMKVRRKKEKGKTKNVSVQVVTKSIQAVMISMKM